MEHKLYKKDTNMDIEHSRIKVTYEKPAEVLGLVDLEMDINTGREDTIDDFEPSELSPNINETVDENNVSYHSKDKNINMQKRDYKKHPHRKRHIKKWQEKVEELKIFLESE